MGDAAGQAVVSVELRVRARDTVGGATQFRGFLRFSGSFTDGATRTPGTSYANYLDSAMAKPGGGDWNLDDLNATEAGVEQRALGNAIFVTTITLNADIVSGGGFAFLLAELAAFSALSLADMPMLARYVRSRHPSRLLISPREYAEAFDELKAMTFPTHFLPGPGSGLWLPA